MIADFLQARGIAHLVTREPGGTALGEAVRSLLLGDAEEHVDQEVIDTEVALVKVKLPLDARTSLLQVVEHYHGKVVDYGPESVIVRLSGTSDKIDAFVAITQQWEVPELIRSGKIVMARGLDAT